MNQTSSRPVMWRQSTRSRNPVGQQSGTRLRLFADLQATEVLLCSNGFPTSGYSPATKAWIVSGEQPSARLLMSTYALFPSATTC